MKSDAAPGQFKRVAVTDRFAIDFVLNGQTVTALTGDTVLTAILTHQRYVRRFEFGSGHRAGFCLMGSCQDCWVNLADGRAVRACTTFIEPGMAIETDLPGHSSGEET